MLRNAKQMPSAIGDHANRQPAIGAFVLLAESVENLFLVGGADPVNHAVIVGVAAAGRDDQAASRRDQRTIGAFTIRAAGLLAEVIKDFLPAGLGVEFVDQPAIILAADRRAAEQSSLGGLGD